MYSTSAKKKQKNKNRNKQNYYSETLGVNIHDGYINGVALWTFAVITWSLNIHPHLREPVYVSMISLA